MTRKRLIFLWLLAGLALASVSAFAGFLVGRGLDLPPPNGVTLETILRSVEQKNLGTMRSIEYERKWWQRTGVWQLDVCRDACLKLDIDPRSGAEVRRKSADGPAAHAMPPPSTQGLAAVVRSFTDRNSGVIMEIEFEHGAWQIKYRVRGLVGIFQPSQSRVLEPVRRTRYPVPARDRLTGVRYGE